MNYDYYTKSNYNPALSSCTSMGVVHDSQGYKNACLRGCDGKSYVVVNPNNTNKVEKFGAFSLSAAIRPPYAGYPTYGCRTCNTNCGCACGAGGPCHCNIIGVT